MLLRVPDWRLSLSQQLIGFLNYISCLSRPVNTSTVGSLVRRTHIVTVFDFEKAKLYLAYLVSTSTLRLKMIPLDCLNVYEECRSTVVGEMESAEEVSGP